MEIELENGLKLEINESDKTSSVIELNQKKKDILIPRYAEYNGEKYKIISIKSFAFKNVDLELLHFADDSEIEYFDSSIFNFSKIKKLQIPASLTKVNDSWLNCVKSISDFEVSPNNKRFKYEQGNFLLWKSEEDSDEFDCLLYARYDIEDAVIPPQIKIVKRYSFSEHPNLKSIIFPENSKLKIIEKFAFGHSPIQKLVLPASVEEIGDNNFHNVENLNDIKISPKNKHYKCFSNKYIFTKSDKNSQTFDVLFLAVRNIKIVQIPSQIKEISGFAINCCKELKSITFEPNSSLEKINGFAINSNPNLTKIVFPKSVKIFGYQSFDGNRNLTSIEILGSSIKIGYSCFSSCSKLTSVTFPNATEIEIEDNIFLCSDEAMLYVLREAKLTGKGYERIQSRIKYIEKQQTSEEISEEKNDDEVTTGSKKEENKHECNKEISNKYDDIDFLMKHIRYLERSLGEFKSVSPFNPEYDKQRTTKKESNIKNADFFIGMEEEQSMYEVVEVIGESNTSIVEKVIDKSSKQRVCKKTLKGETATFKDVQNAIKEFEILYSMNHPSICRAISINTQEELEDGTTTISLFLEFVDFKLTDFIKSGFASNTLKSRIVVEISHGMKYLHSKNLIYRDLNINNIMLNCVFEAKLIDFGLARINEKLFGEEAMSAYSLTKNVGTDVFMSPEMFNDDDYDNKTDVYSFGVVVYFIFVGGLPKQTINDIIKGKSIDLPKESPSISKACIELISKCLSIDPKDRPTFSEIIEFIRKNNYMLSSDVDPTVISQRDYELEMIKA